MDVKEIITNSMKHLEITRYFSLSLIYDYVCWLVFN